MKHLILFSAVILGLMPAWAEDCTPDCISLPDFVRPVGEWELFEAAKIGDLDKVATLLSEGYMGAEVDVDSRDDRGFTPLFWAAAHGHTEVARLLIQMGADVNARIPSGGTPLHVAAWNGAVPETLILLLASGADVTAQDDNGSTPLHFALASDIESPNRLKAIDWLVFARADLNAKDRSGQTPLYAQNRTSFELIKFLVRNRADLNTRDNEGRTPLMWAAELNDEKLVELFVRSGANVNIPDYDGRTPVLMATLHGNRALVKLFIHYRADINAADNSNMNPLKAAGNTSIAQDLKAAGAVLPGTSPQERERQRQRDQQRETAERWGWLFWLFLGYGA